ncbi:MAG: Glycerol-3-phosphate acyltransferase [Phycisphaerae bacterium]|nr:Glycerol-3-phosphate acyltransferase [Phycisphaerae bacterium]
MMVIIPIAAYLIGSIPIGYLVGRWRGLDIREHGSHNIGATNVSRVLGKKYGYTVFGLDLLKGLLPVLWAGRHLVERSAASSASGSGWWILVAGCAVVGHMFPIFLRFRGGKGVATALGATLGIYPYLTWPGLGCFLIWLVVTLLSRYVSLGSIVACVAFPLLVIIRPMLLEPAIQPWPLTHFSLLLATLIIYRHRANIRRLLQGTENKIGTKPVAS